MVGVGVPPEVEVGVGLGRLELEPETMEVTMMGFPPPVGTVEFCSLPGRLATQ